MKKLSMIALIAMTIVPTIAMSDDNVSVDKAIAEQYERNFENPKAKFPHGLQFGIGMSATSGLNAFVGYNNKDLNSFWAKRFGIRFDFATYSPIKSTFNRELNNIIGDDGYKMSERVKLQDFKVDGNHYGAIVDFYPFGDTWFWGGWRLSGGYMAGKLELNAAPWSEKLPNGLTRFYLDDWMLFYNGDQMLARGNVNWKYSGPYLGTGFDLGIFHGFKIFVDAGVVFANKTPEVTLDVPLDGLMRIETVGGVKQLVFVKDNEEAYKNFKTGYDTALADARNEVKDFEYYPMVKVGFMYRF